MITKRCTKCKVEKTKSEFYKHKKMSDGYLSECKECVKKRIRAHRVENLDRIQAYDRMRGSLPHRVAARNEYQKTDAYRESHRNACDKWQTKHPERRKASHIVGNAIRDGKLIPWPICAEPDCRDKPQAHHPDYSSPLDVVWLCSKHHSMAHSLVRKK